MASSLTIPRRLPILTIIDHVLLPGSSMRIPIRNTKNMSMIKSQLLKKDTLGSTVIGVIPSSTQHETDEVHHPIGTAAVVVQVTSTNWPRPAYTLLVTGLCRFKLEKLLQETPFLIAMVSQLDHIPSRDLELQNSAELESLVKNFREQALKLVEMLDVSIPVVAKLKSMLDSLPSEHLPDVCTAVIKASYTEKIQILDAVNLRQRFEKTLPLLLRQIEGLKLLQRARKENVEIVDRRVSDRSAVQVSSDLDDIEDEDDLHDLESRIRAANIPQSAKKSVMKELKRLKKMSPQQPDHAILRHYLDLVADLPWSISTKDTLDVHQARMFLDADHYGLEKLKKRVVEYLAVRQLKNNLSGPILCFVGPPGVGKTSVGRSIARTLGRKFHRISLGGVCDQSDIRGHRRTYIGSMPGRIIHGLKLVGSNNPVFLLDEVDKLSKSIQGDPASALLEVLDQEQNGQFTDHAIYLNLPFDLSQVLFIATANTISTIPAPLLDRMETIHIAGYTQEEKVAIATRHLLPKQLGQHGLNAGMLDVPEDTLRCLVSRYTREAGVRALERQLAAICRAVAVKSAEADSQNTSLKLRPEPTRTDGNSNTKVSRDTVSTEDFLDHPPDFPIVITESALGDILGPAPFYEDTAERLSQPGVAIGLAWTTLGGTIMYVEATKMDGDGKVILTGHLGDVMKESANLALNWLRSHSRELKLDASPHLMKNTDVHIHFPEGAVGKDGPSAGVTIATVLLSLFSGNCVRSDTAMTGEITLRGHVLPVGGIKEKVLAAHRAGLPRIILPRLNEKDLHEIPNNVKLDMQFIFASNLAEVFSGAFYTSFDIVDETRGISSKL